MATLNYLHGVNTKVEKSEGQATNAVGTIPCYIGSLPIQRLNTNGTSGFDYTAHVCKPILIKTANDLANFYSDDWATYTACEAIHAHFKNDEEIIAPIIVVNLFNPAIDVEETPTELQVSMISEGLNKVGYIEDSKCIIDNLTLTADGVSFEDGDIVFAYEGDKVKITIKKKDFAASTVTASYKKAKFSISTIEEPLLRQALNSLSFAELHTGHIPNILVAPGLTSIKKYHDIILEKCINRMAEKWNAVMVSDIPCRDNLDLTSAIRWKEENQYNHKFDKLCFPKLVKGNKKYHYSTLMAYTMQATDLNNGNTPHVSPSNKVLNCDGAVLEDGTPFLITETEANKANEKGITTINIVQRKIRTWGPHMANYNFNNLESILYEDRGDANIRMVLYLANYLQYNYMDSIDTPFTRKDVDSIITSVQKWLNSLVNEGKLLFAEITFNEDENQADDLVNGDFVFNVTYTLTPNAKSITFKMQYTATGLSLLTGGEA